MFQITRLLAVLAFVLVLTTNGLACVTSPVEDKLDSYEFGNALIESFAWGQSALDSVVTMQRDPSTVEELISQTAKFLTGLKQAKDDYHCALESVQPFKLSKDEFISNSAELFVELYSALEAREDQKINEFETTLRGKARAVSLADTIIQTADDTVTFHKLWLDIDKGAALSLNVFVDFDAEARLTITQQQRKDLIKRIENLFEAAIKDGTKSDEGPTVAALLVRTFLMNQDWKSRDDR